MMVCPQDRHERYLIEHLNRAGGEVERPMELSDFEQALTGFGLGSDEPTVPKRPVNRPITRAAMEPGRECVTAWARDFRRNLFACLLRGGRRGQRPRDE